jgi:hypothetical protein
MHAPFMRWSCTRLSGRAPIWSSFSINAAASSQLPLAIASSTGVCKGRLTTSLSYADLLPTEARLGRSLFVWFCGGEYAIFDEGAVSFKSVAEHHSLWPLRAGLKVSDNPNLSPRHMKFA